MFLVFSSGRGFFTLHPQGFFFFFFSLPSDSHAGYFLRLFISIPTPDTGIRLGSVALREHFHTLIFVCTVSCSTRRLWTAGLLYMRKRVGCQKAQFHSRDFASGYMCSVLRHEMAHVWMCAYIHVCVCPNFILMLFLFCAGSAEPSKLSYFILEVHIKLRTLRSSVQKVRILLINANT